ncbi:MAG: VOC family protein [Candidatus Nanopelagicales bacterium]
MKFDSYIAGTPSWVDLMASDQDAAIAFYCNLFGWECMKSGPDMGSYGMCYQGDIPVAGIGQMPDEIQFPASWTTYISVDDAAAVVAAVGEAGGQVMADVMDIPGPGDALMGRMAVLADPTGGVFGVWEPHEHIGSGIANEPVSFAWNELLSRNPQASRDFLAQVFGYEWAAMPGTPDGMEYFTAKVDGKDVFGAMDVPAALPAEVPTHWQTYFAVADTDDTLARAVASGGTALGPAFDSPFGRMAVIEDPQGARFSIMQMPAA